MIAFRCEQCGKAFKVKDELAGKKTKCPGCGKPLVVPGTGATTEAGQSKASSSNLEVERTVPPDPDSLLASGGPALVPKGRDERTLPPKNAVGENTNFRPQGELTQSMPAEAPNTELYDFLAPAQQPDELGRLGPYRVLKVLGHGGMGVVYKAEDPQLKRLVALKAMLPSLGASESSRKRFLREAQTAAAISHDNIVQIFQVGEDRGVPFIAMQFLEGEPLDDRLKREGRFSMEEILRIGRETAEGLAAAHKRGLIHRDIKPANLWLEGDKSRVKILDFGLARAAADDTHLTQSGAIIGTPAYMAPEQAAAEQVDPRCDLFSLGCVLYRLATGEPPFKGGNTLAIISALAMVNPSPPADLCDDVPGPISDLIMKLLAKKPDDRPPSAQAVVQALQEIESQATALIIPRAEPKTKKVKNSDTTRTQAVRTQPRLSQKKKLPLAWLIGGSALSLVVSGSMLFFLLRPGVNQANRGQDLLPDTKNAEAPPPKLAVAKPPEGKNAMAPLPKFTNGLGMKFVLIPAGEFMMGSTPQEIERCIALLQGGADSCNPEGPAHEVEITQPFYMGATEVTLGQFRQFVNDNTYQVGDPRWLKPDFEQTDNHPVVWISWNNAVDFCTWLSEKEGKKYRLPTEAEWEYSCRVGKAGTRYGFGSDDGDLGLYAWCALNLAGKTHPVGQKKVNGWGLHDMHGNVLEWCHDWYDANYYRSSPKKNPPGPSSGPGRVFRGGCYDGPPVRCRSAGRSYGSPDARGDHIGFRVVLLVSLPGGVRP